MKKYIFFICILSGLLISCDPENPNNPNDQEVITTLRFNAFSSTDTIHPAFSDPDGPGGMSPTIDTIFLQTLGSYDFSLELLDETKTPIDTITNEILEEGTEHQFFFSITGTELATAYNDFDENFKPIGIQNILNAGLASSGSITITLRHGPNKTAPFVSDGDITNAGGETDVEVTFPFVIQ